MSKVVSEECRTGKSEVRDDFFYASPKEPHNVRRKKILEAHPDMEKLYGHDSRPVPYVVLMVFTMLTLAALAPSMSWTCFLLVGWIVGGAISHSLSLMAHECSHDLIFASPKANVYFAIFCNLGTGIPSATTFKKYHLEHHVYQGKEGVDVDLPTKFEGRFFNTPFRKFLYLTCQSLVYSVRPMFIRPKAMTFMDAVNYVAVISSDLILVYFFGLPSFGFLFYSLFMGMGLHPVAGHFIAEHYIFPDDVKNSSTISETYSYYGPLNLLCWNVGYHNEHHDFPRIPGWKLPLVKQMAGEFYENLPQHKSWTMVLVNFIFDKRITPFNRALRGN
jgi:sphingolipid delta-4 desaturase